MGLWILSFQLLAANSSAYEDGRWAGRLVWPAILIAGILKCQQVAKRPTANWKCIHALTAVLLSFLIATVLDFFRQEGTPPDPIVSIIAALAIFTTTLVAVVLAIIGLVDLGGRKGEPIQGRKQALWAIVLSVFMWSLLSLGGYMAIRKRFEVPDSLKMAQAEANSVLRFASQNFRFKVPPKPWQQVDAKHINPVATLAFLRANPQIFMMVISEQMDAASALTTEALAAMAKANLQSATTKARFSTDGPFAVNGIAGHRIAADAELGNQAFHHINWVFSRNGFLFQFTVWGPQHCTTDVETAFAEMASRFEIIDPERKATAGGAAAATDLPSPVFPYTLKLAGTSWMPWSNLAKDAPDAETGALHGTTACLTVVPVSMDGLTPSREALLNALLTRVGVEYPGQTLTEMKEITEGSYKGVQFEYERTIEKAVYRYRCRVLEGGGCTYLINSWIVKNGTDQRDHLLDEGLKRVVLKEPPTPPLPLEQRSAQSRRVQAYVLNDIGVYYFKAKQYPECIPFYQAALDAHPEDAVLLDNLAGGYTACQREKEALAVIEKHQARFPKNTTILSRHAHLLVALERSKEACDVFGELFSGDHKNEFDFTTYIDALVECKLFDRALEALEKYRARYDSLDLLLRHASVFSEKEDPKGAIALLRTQQEKGPFNAEVAFAMIDHLEDMEENAEALKVCQQLLDNGFDSAQAWFEKGVCEERLKWYTQAKASFEEALKKAPRDETVRKWLDHVSGVLGEGNNSGVKKAIEPVPVPEAWLAREPEDAHAEYLKDFSAFYIHRLTAASFVAGKDYRVTEYRGVRVRDTTGVARFSTFQFGFDPLSEEIFLNRLTVRDAQGQVVSTGKVSDCYVIDEGGTQATQRKTLNIPIPGLQPGYAIDLTVTRKDITAPDRMPFLMQGFSTGFPVLKAGFLLRGDVQTLVHQATPGVTVVQADQLLSCMLECPPVYWMEGDQPDASTFLPYLWLNASGQSWKDAGEAYLKEIAPTLETDPAVSPVAAELLKGTASEREKVDALVRYLQDNYTYRAIEFGRRAHVPNTPAVILRNRYGDCKDHALLLLHLLKHAGIAAHLALVHTGSSMQPELPSLDQFDHMILYLPGNGAGRFLDTTDKDSDLSLPVPYGLAGRQALVLEAGRSRLVRIPDYPPNSNAIGIERAMTLNDQGDLSVHEVLTFQGYYASHVRGYLKSMEPTHRQTAIQDFLSGYQDAAEIQTLDPGDLVDRTQPLRMELTYSCRGCFQPAGDQWVGQLPAPWERCYLGDSHQEKRHTPFRFEFPIAVESALKMTWPAAFTPIGTPEWNGGSEKSPLTWTLRGTSEGAGMTARFKATRAGACFPVEDFAPYQASLREALGTLRTRLIVSKTGK